MRHNLYHPCCWLGCNENAIMMVRWRGRLGAKGQETRSSRWQEAGRQDSRKFCKYSARKEYLIVCMTFDETRVVGCIVTDKRMIQIMTHASFYEACVIICIILLLVRVSSTDTLTKKRMMQIMTHASFYEACVIICIILLLARASS